MIQQNSLVIRHRPLLFLYFIIIFTKNQVCNLCGKILFLTVFYGILTVKNGLVSSRNKPKYTIYCFLNFIDQYLVALGLRIFACAVLHVERGFFLFVQLPQSTDCEKKSATHLPHL